MSKVIELIADTKIKGRGRTTNRRIREQALALVAIEGNFEAVGRMMDRSASTIRTWAEQSNVQDNQFAELRREIEQSYIIEAWSSITKAHDALYAKLDDPEVLKSISAFKLSEIIVNLHNTISNVAQHMMAIQINVNTTIDNTVDLDVAAFMYVADKANLTVPKLKELLGLA